METEWTRVNLQKLLASMKRNMTKNDDTRIYIQGLRSLDWRKVAFPPFTAAACEEKWKDMMKKMRKLRTLPDLIIEAEDVISNPTQNKKIHPECPKAPKPANAMFFEEKIDTFRKKFPRLNNRELMKLVMKKYKELPGEKKSKYEEKYKLAKEEHEILMKKFRKSFHKAPNNKRKKISEDSLKKESCEDTEGNGTKKSRDLELPSKPPRDGYSLFCKEQLSHMEGVPRRRFVSVWAQRWRPLTCSQKQEYKARCQEMQREYSVKLSECLSAFDEDEQQQILKENNLKIPKLPMAKKGRFQGEPKTPCRNGNVLFCKEKMNQLKTRFPKARERFGKIQQMWKELPEEEKDEYRERVKEKIMTYTRQLQKWFTMLTAAEQEAYCKTNPEKQRYLKIIHTETENRSSAPTEVIYIPSDSEDEEMEYSSSDEEQRNEVEEEEEDDDDDVEFHIY